MIKKRLLELMPGSWKYIAKNVAWQWGALLCSAGAMSTAAGLLAGAYEAACGAAAAGSGFPGGIAGAAALVLACMALRALCVRQAARATALAGAGVKKELRSRLYAKLARFGASYHEKTPTAEAVQVAVEGVEQLEVYFSQYLPQLFYSLLAPVTLFVLLSVYSLRASLVLLFCVPLIPLVIVLVQKIAKRLLNKYWGAYTGLGDSFLENLQGLTTLKIYGADAMKAEQMDREAEHFRKITMKVLMMQLNSIIVMDVVAYGGAAAGMAAALWELKAGAVSLRGMLSIILLSADFFIPMRMLGSFFHVAMNGMAACDRLFAILDLPDPERGGEELTAEDFPEAAGSAAGPVFPAGAASSARAGSPAAAKLSAKTGVPATAVCLEGVGFSYGPEREILSGVSLVIPARGMAALVGTSGCGKSTVAGILTGRNKGYAGSVKIGGKELSAVSEESLMRNVTLVSHDSCLFKGTVAENLRMAAPAATDEELWDVLAKVRLDGFLRGQDGLGTRLLERAENLSGGQRQRLSLARALLHASPVYIFDEATSNIDAESEEQIMRVIRELARNAAVLLISHRLANAAGASCIYLLRDGRVAEAGTQEELMALSGEYARLYRGQKELEGYAGVPDVSCPAVSGVFPRGQEGRAAGEGRAERKEAKAGAAASASPEGRGRLYA